MFTSEYFDVLITEARSLGGAEAMCDGPKVADALVCALGDRVKEHTGDAHSLGFSGVSVGGEYTLTIMWCGT